MERPSALGYELSSSTVDSVQADVNKLNLKDLARP